MHPRIKEFFTAHFGCEPERMQDLSAKASERQIFRLQAGQLSAIGVEKAEPREHVAFLALTRHFRKFNLPVPEVYAEDQQAGVYLIEDLGDCSLYELLDQTRTAQDPFPREIEAIYSKVIELLPRFQIEAGRSLDFSVCYPHQIFQSESMLVDMRSFRDNFLRRVEIAFDANKLQQEFFELATHLEEAEANYFMYRDFQGRNIMVRDGAPYFLDYSKGRRGPLQYDIVSLLFQSSAAIPAEVRKRLLDVYLSSIEKYISVDRSRFMHFYYTFVYLRMLQVLGVYGIRGLAEKREYFIQCIPMAMANLRFLERETGLPIKLPELSRIITSLVALSDEHYLSLGKAPGKR